jgi:hypothetical protein
VASGQRRKQTRRKRATNHPREPALAKFDRWLHAFSGASDTSTLLDLQADAKNYLSRTSLCGWRTRRTRTKLKGNRVVISNLLSDAQRVSFDLSSVIKARRLGSSNFRALIAEERTKETRCAPAKRLEITARLPFNFVLVRLVLHPHKEVLEWRFLVSACKSSKVEVSEAPEKARNRRANLDRAGSRGWCLALLHRVCFLRWPEATASVKF